MNVVPSDIFKFGGERVKRDRAWKGSCQGDVSFTCLRVSMHVQNCTLLKRFRNGCVPFPVNWNFVVNSNTVCNIVNVVHVHGLDPGETPSYSASHKDQQYVQRSSISQSISKGRVRLRFGSRFFFPPNLLKFSTVFYI